MREGAVHPAALNGVDASSVKALSVNASHVPGEYVNGVPPAE